MSAKAYKEINGERHYWDSDWQWASLCDHCGKEIPADETKRTKGYISVTDDDQNSRKLSFDGLIFHLDCIPMYLLLSSLRTLFPTQLIRTVPEDEAMRQVKAFLDDLPRAGHGQTPNDDSGTEPPDWLKR